MEWKSKEVTVFRHNRKLAQLWAKQVHLWARGQTKNEMFFGQLRGQCKKDTETIYSNAICFNFTDVLWGCL